MANQPTPNENDVAALLTFLTDPSEQTVTLAKNHLKQILRQNPAYRNLLENPSDPTVASHARVFLEETRLEDLKEAFRELAGQGKELDLEQGTILLAQSAYPALHALSIPRTLDRMAGEIEKELDAQEASSSREVMIFRRYLFDRQGFMGNERNYYDPDNSYLHKVLESKTGIPISLSCVCCSHKRLRFAGLWRGLAGAFHRRAQNVSGYYLHRSVQSRPRSHASGLYRSGSPARHDVPRRIFVPNTQPPSTHAHDCEPRQRLHRTKATRKSPMADPNFGAL